MLCLLHFQLKKRGSDGDVWSRDDYCSAIGPTLSGWIIEHYSWRMLFDLVLPIAILTLIFAAFKLKDVTPQRAIKLDVISLILSSIGFGGLLYGFSSAGKKVGTTYLSMEQSSSGRLL